MAEGGGHRDTFEELKEKFLTCPICQDVYSDPATLQCGHTFCRKCLTDFTKTRPDAVRDKVIPCSLRCEGTKVPDPSKPVGKWSQQIKPYFIINGLMETFNSKSDLPAKKTGRKQKYARCADHGEDLKLICEGCNQAVCNTCCSVDHRQCKSVVFMEAQFEAMQKYLVGHMPKLNTNIEGSGVSIATMKSTVDKIMNSNRNVKSRIEKQFQKLIEQIRQREAEVLKELETISKSQVFDFQERIQLEEINLQKYQQQLQFIQQTVNSDSLIDTCNMYLSLVSDERKYIDKVRRQLTRDRVSDVTFSHDTDSLIESLNRLNFGELNKTYEQFDVENVSVSDRVVSSRKIDPRVDTRVDSDEQTPGLTDVTVLIVDGGETLVVTDWTNNCVKSFFTRNKRTDHSKLPLDRQPGCISQFNDNHVLVVVPNSKQIVRVSVRPQLVLLSVINTIKTYVSLAVLSSSSLAAGSYSSCVDILDMEGIVMRSIDTHNNTSLFAYPDYICVHPEGHLLVSDRDKKSVICVTSQGQVVWKYTPTGDRALRHPQGITTTPTGDVLLVDWRSNKIIQLSGSGQFVRDILTSQDGIDKPRGLYLNKHNSLFVCDNHGQVKQYKESI